MSAVTLHAAVKYQVAVLQGCLGNFALVRAENIRLNDAFPQDMRGRLEQSVEKRFGKLPVAYAAREQRGYLFEAPPAIVNDVGLVMEDLSCRPVQWQEMKLSLANETEPGRAA